MNEKSILKGVVKGSIISLMITFTLMILLSLLVIKVELSNGNYNIFYLVITSISLVVGAAFSAKYNGRKGYISGALVGVIYVIFIALLSKAVTGEIHMQSTIIKSIVLNIVVGSIAGILGVNL